MFGLQLYPVPGESCIMDFLEKTELAPCVVLFGRFLRGVSPKKIFILLIFRTSSFGFLKLGNDLVGRGIFLKFTMKIRKEQSKRTCG